MSGGDSSNPRTTNFDWVYYDRMVAAIKRARLKWIPILSFHQCGGNVGDDCDIPIPGWLFETYGRERLGIRSEQGNWNYESISPWASRRVLHEYRELMQAFAHHFRPMVDLVPEINVSLGTAGELRYPAYNAHDQNAGYPTRGALQAYSPAAKESFRTAMLVKYRTTKEALSAWGQKPKAMIEVPKDADEFFRSGAASASVYGRDFFTWYQDTLLDHGRRILTTALSVFAKNGFPTTDIGAKIPGLHWRMGQRAEGKLQLSDRGVELAAGLITADRSQWRDPHQGHGYAKIIGLFRELDRAFESQKLVLHFTCLEMNDGDGDPSAASLAKTLVQWVGQEAKRQGVLVRGENALAGLLHQDQAWDNMEEALSEHHYQGLTLLRMNSLFENPTGRRRLPMLTRKGTATQ